VVDLNSIHVKYLPGRAAAYRAWGHNADGTPQDPGLDGHSHEADYGHTELGIDARGGDYLSEMTLQVDLPENFAILRNVCSAAIDPPLTVVQNKTICIDLDKPCMYGAVDPFTTVNLMFSGGNPAMDINVDYPAHKDATGTVIPAGTTKITLDANGNGVFSYQVGDSGSYTLQVQPDNTQANAAGVSFPATDYTACVKACLPTLDTASGVITSSEPQAAC
jgi:hypothetical protein